LKSLKQAKPKNNKSASLKPQLLKKCYESVPSEYFSAAFEVKEELFQRNRKISHERSMKLHEDLDEVEICLFNQISSRFDEILSVLRTI
jgi:hypothetical protein